MIDLHTLDDLQLLRKAVDLECKLAAVCGAVYCLPGAALPKLEEMFGAGFGHLVGSSTHLPDSSGYLAGNSRHCLPHSMQAYRTTESE